MSEKKMKWSVPDHTGFIHPEKAKKGELEELFPSPLVKYNQCHGAKGQFCSGGGSKGSGGGSAAGSKELAEHPPVPGARTNLAPFIGKEVKMDYWVEKPGRTGQDRCIKDIKVPGMQGSIQHMWAQKLPDSVLKAKYGQKQTAVGTVYRYKKKTGWDWAIGDIKSVVNKAADVEKYNHCHGAKGQFCSSGGTGGGGGFANEEDKAPVIVGDVVMAPQSSMAPLQDKKFKKPDNITDDEYKALRMYGGTDYAVLNSYLRNKPEEMTDKFKWMTDSIDSAMSKQEPIKGQMKVYRGSEYSRLFGKKKPEEIIGAKITDKGFMSTSASSEVAERFGSARFTITLPPGMKALDMIKNTGTVAAKSEREWLLPRGTQIEITHVTQTKGGFLGMGKKTYIEAKVVPVEKSIEKYNHCHGAKGQFCSSGGTGGGGGGGFQNTSGELTSEEQSAVDSYANTGFKAMNNALRGKEPMTPEIEKQVSHIDAAMAKNPLTKNETVFRGIKSTKFLNGETDPAKIKGMTIVDKGFMSTSANTEVAAGFSVGKGGVNMTIHVPKGTKALDIRNHIFTDQAFEEHEVLLARNTKLKITRAEKQGAQLSLTAEVVS